MGTAASQINSLTIVYKTVYSDADQSKHQSSVSLAFVWGIHRGPVNSPHKWPVTRKMFPFDDVIMAMICVVNFINLWVYKAASVMWHSQITVNGSVSPKWHIFLFNSRRPTAELRIYHIGCEISTQRNRTAQGFSVLKIESEFKNYCDSLINKKLLHPIYLNN